MAVKEATGEWMYFCNGGPCQQDRLHTVIWDVHAQQDGREISRTPLWWKCQQCGEENERED